MRESNSVLAIQFNSNDKWNGIGELLEVFV